MKSVSRVIWCGVAALWLVLSTGQAFAQQVFGSIYGTVTDSTGAAVVNAAVTIKDLTKDT